MSDTPSSPVLVAGLLDRLAGLVASGAHLRLDSREVQAGDVFVAVAGHQTDGRAFIDQALAAGAAVVLCDAPGPQASEQWGERVILVPGLRGLLGELAHAWYGRASEAMTVIAVTGTNGKTSCVQWLAQALTAQGVRCGRIGTLGVDLPQGVSLPGSLTTPDVLTLHRVLAQLRDAGAQAVALEASSIGIEQGRLDGVRIAVAGYTNLTRDHLDYHGDMVCYETAKRRLFETPGLQARVVNADDPAGCRILDTLPGGIGFSRDPQNSRNDVLVRAVDIQYSAQGVRFTLALAQTRLPVTTGLIGLHNVENLLLVAGVLHALHWPPARIATALSQARPVAGRLEMVAALADAETAALPQVVVDYAHTPDSLARTLAALRPQANARGGRLVCLFGCGGERDAGKRAEMGRIAAAGADLVVLTSDNPRSEAPQAIIDQIMQGVPESERTQVQIVCERAQAILRTIWRAQAADLIVLAGKGHETYQEVCGQRRPFDDRQWARAALALRPVPVICSDTRSLTRGALFVALSGEHYDGHDYLEAAQAAGARAAIVARPVTTSSLAQIVLGDTRQALGQLASAWRALHALPLIAVTGSNGKTTTKEMIATILAAWVGVEARLASPGNFNNDIGVPLTLLRLRATHRVAVVELGMNHPGEIAVLAAMAAPTVALVLNAQREHQEFMGTVQAVARENGSVLSFLPQHGVAVYPARDVYTPTWDALSGSRTRWCFSLLDGAEGCDVGEVQARDISETADGLRCRVVTPVGEGDLTLPLPGRHNLHNALAAVACVLAVGVPLATALAALAGFTAVAGRMQRLNLACGTTLIDDTYNADPDSVRAAIDVLAQLPAPRALVLGDMGELGEQAEAMHREVGTYARTCGIEMLYTLGAACAGARDGYGAGARGFAHAAEVIDALLAARPASVLVKGSRFMRMERVVSGYKEKIEQACTGGVHAA